MRNKAITALAARTAKAAAGHWQDCLESGLPDHTPEAHAEVNRCIADYFEQLQMLPEPATKGMILGAIETLFQRLDEIKVRFGPQLLETDEREIFVTATIAAAEMAGLNMNEFEHRDPTHNLHSF